MAHTIREKTKLLHRVRRIRGQVEAIERSLEDEKGCSNVLQLIVGARGAFNALMAEVLEDHIQMHVADPGLAKGQRSEGAAELIEAVRTYLK